MSKSQKTLPVLITVILCLLGFYGCANPNQPTPISSTSQATLESSITQTPALLASLTIQIVERQLTPTPAVTPSIDLTRGFREWFPAPILIQTGVIHDQKRDPFDRDPSFVLYADGTLIKKSCATSRCETLTVKLNEKQICALLNTIELYGFFEYDPSSYQPPVAGGEITFIEVAAWRNQSIALYQLKDWIEDPNWLERLLKCDGCRKSPEIKPALINTYRLIENFSPPGIGIYHPQQLALWLSYPELAGEPVDWALGSPSLNRLAEMSRCANAGQRQAVVLRGSEAESVAGYINQVINEGLSPIFTEDSLVYQISSRWLLPYEQAAGCGSSTNQFPSLEIPPATELMICRVSDGIIPTPTTTLFP
ncbi:MAG: hypothetical protein WCF08_00305 [Anaerolineaceae bacterium]